MLEGKENDPELIVVAQIRQASIKAAKAKRNNKMASTMPRPLLNPKSDEGPKQKLEPSKFAVHYKS